MNSMMNMLKRTKRGSYMVEAAITLPILIISMCSLVLIIKIIAACEVVTFVTSENLIDIMFGSFSEYDEISLCKEILDMSDDISDLRIKKLKYLYNDEETNDLISLEAEANFKVINPIGINGKIRFKEKVLCRGFTGNTQEINPLAESEFTGYTQSIEVYIFPKYGEKYHKKDCKYIKQNISENSYIINMDKEDALRKGYTPCIICQGAAYE